MISSFKCFSSQIIINLYKQILEGYDGGALTSGKEMATEVVYEDDEDNAKTLHVPSESLLWKMIKERGLKWTTNVHPTECPIHDAGPINMCKLEKATAEYKEANDAIEKVRKTLRELLDKKKTEGWTEEDDVMHTKLRQEESILSDVYGTALGAYRVSFDAVRTYKRHISQYETCRKTVKEIESRLQPGEAVLYRDFVNQYMSGGQKLLNLVFVLLWHDGDRTQRFTKVMKFNHMCDDTKGSNSTGSCDAYYMADVWDQFLGVCQHLKRKNITKLYVSGDHGPHFACAQTHYKESAVFDDYGIELFMFFLCSYHAFNRCDGAGVEGKSLYEWAIRNRTATEEANALVDILNRSEYHNSVGVDMGKINRSANVFPEELQTEGEQELRKKCEVKYSWTNEDGTTGRQAGVILCRDIPCVPWETGEPYEVYDLRKNPPEGPICRKCSKKKQRPIYHTSENCEVAKDIVGILKDKEMCIQDGGPSEDRMVGY